MALVLEEWIARPQSQIALAAEALDIAPDELEANEDLLHLG
jgi:hypothetical protein